ncbi:MAG: hypothetical protein LiPW30_692 [Parcubacteria group bacterium LiPW_30]|nr:MAG: hypothetical protein LiPW30_692 [Parcubacteria group bacterium LiPW_30]
MFWQKVYHDLPGISISKLLEQLRVWIMNTGIVDHEMNDAAWIPCSQLVQSGNEVFRCFVMPGTHQFIKELLGLRIEKAKTAQHLVLTGRRYLQLFTFGHPRTAEIRQPLEIGFVAK